MLKNYAMPLKCGELTKKNPKLQPVTLEDSVRRHLYLILVSRFGCNRFDPTYGCELWEHDFENLKALDGKKHFIENSIKTLLVKHEPRLVETVVNLNITEDSLKDPLKTAQKITRRVEVKIRGRLGETNKSFEPPPFVIFFSPVTLGDKNI